jgi:SAM-dependent MidA family methyltransferase
VVPRVGDGIPEGQAAVDPRWAGSQPALVAAIRGEILASPKQRITFARFMERALTEPGLGYYATSELRPTREGDFLTAPELHPFFGRCLGRFLTAVWRAAGAPERYLVREHGAGRGTLRDTVMAGLAADGSALTGAIEWHSLDLPGHRGGPEEAAHAIVANEFLDALPVHRLVQAGVLREAYVEWRDGWFGETLADPSSADLADHLAADGIVLREGQRAEICLAAPRWLVAAGSSLAPGGLVLVIDYGHEATELYGPRRLAGSLLTYREHRVAEDPFAAVGHTDLTSHVDVTALQRAARSAGLKALGDTSQGRFLAGLGLGQLLSDLGRDPGTEPEAYLLARSAVARLLDPRHLGAFRVLLWGRPRAEDAAAGVPGFEATLPGFEAEPTAKS